jgi:hypothetical protein
MTSTLSSSPYQSFLTYAAGQQAPITQNYFAHFNSNFEKPRLLFLPLSLSRSVVQHWLAWILEVLASSVKFSMTLRVSIFPSLIENGLENLDQGAVDRPER